MSTEENKVVVHRMFDDALNKGNTSLINEVFAPGYVDHSPLPAPVPGPEDFAKRLVALRGGFVEEALFGEFFAENDLVAFTWTFNGVHHGTFAGLAATGKKLTLSGINVERVENGKIVEHWSQYDLAGLMKQMSSA
jgi:steroid delta-isomerase-like uncharacterized protein